MKKYYFTFGSWEKFPYKDTYLVVMAPDKSDAIETFRKRYPDVTVGIYRYSSCYDETSWMRTDAKRRFCDVEGQSPAEIIWSKCYGDAPEGYDDVFIYVSTTRQIIRIAEGTGDNLLPEDRKEGYVDYIMYDIHILDTDIPSVDGGQLMTTQHVQEKYKKLADSIPDVLDMEYGDPLTDFIFLT